MSDIVITVNNFNKSFGKLRAVCDLSFEVKADSCFGFLGPNGAGKTTVMKTLYGRCLRDRNADDRVNVFGYDPAENELAIKSLSGVVQQENNLDDELNVIQNLHIYAKFYGLSSKAVKKQIDYLLEFFELGDKAKSRIRELSGGMKRRLVIARALLNNPKLLILDEPTTGLDPQVRHLIWDKLRQLKRQGTTILLTTHYMEEAFQICDEVLIMHQGKKMMHDTPLNLIEKNIESYVLEITGIESLESLEQSGLPGNVRVDKSQQVTRLYSEDTEQLRALANKLEGAQYYLRQANLEDVFLKATGKGLNEKQ
ncbi:MAG: ABC transporter ATP-binding protein [Sedimentisphaerales bacterium]|nr:ABC transporter ATP-binding protein [Sedimentisphaerales bacterium]